MALGIFTSIRKNEVVHAVALAIFRVSGVAMVGITLFEAIVPGYFGNWFNPMWCLIIVLVSGILTIANKQYD